MKARKAKDDRCARVYPFPENSLDEDCDEGEEEEKPNSLLTTQGK